MNPKTLQSTLEQLEKDIWPKPAYDSNLVLTCHALRKKPLKDFDVENLRIMIGQDFSLPHLVPLAIEVLSGNILAEGDMYEGDLLKAVLTSKRTYWKSVPEVFASLKALVLSNEELLDETDREFMKEFKRLGAEMKLG
ncbi:MAG: contact-dependent growth inhibition system immunity protein [Saprospiraceae bacterium]